MGSGAGKKSWKDRKSLSRELNKIKDQLKREDVVEFTVWTGEVVDRFREYDGKPTTAQRLAIWRWAIADAKQRIVRKATKELIDNGAELYEEAILAQETTLSGKQ